MPVAAYAESVGDKRLEIRLTGLVISEDGTKAIKVNGEGTDALQLGNELAGQAISQGTNQILALSEVK